MWPLRHFLTCLRNKIVFSFLSYCKHSINENTRHKLSAFVVLQIKSKRKNMKKHYLMLLLSLILGNVYSQSFNWAVKGGLYAYDYGYGIATDAAGNVIVAGKYEQAANFSGTIL